MSEMPLDISADSGSDVPAADLLRDQLIDSRQRWQHLVSLATDMAFETDLNGRFSFVFPEEILGWSADALTGQPSELLLQNSGCPGTFNPFRPTGPVRGQRVWLKRGDGGGARMAISATPLFGPDRHIIGARGIGTDVTDTNVLAAKMAGSLRRGEVLDYILWCVAQEVMAPRMMDAALSALTNALAAEGATVVALLEDGHIELLHECGPSSLTVQDIAARLVAEHGSDPSQAVTTDGRLVLTMGCQTRFGANAAMAVWRTADARPWDHDDTLLAGSAISIIRMILEHEAIQHEMGRQARTDPLTGLLNRRAFLDEMQRHIDRLDHEHEPGTLMFADLDAFKLVNDLLGHEMGDLTLVHIAKMLRDLLRPSDLIARLGGDEFAVWMSGADQMTAAERADHLRLAVPAELAILHGTAVKGVGLSIGIACRSPGSREPIKNMIHRADLAMYEVKRSGRGNWRVSQLEES